MSTRLTFGVPVLKFDDCERSTSGRMLRRDLPDGAAAWSLDNEDRPAVLNFVCGCGCKSVQTVTIKGPRNSKGWDWDGNLEAPTLHPSIWSKQPNGGCGWHGWVKAGVMDGKVEAG